MIEGPDTPTKIVIEMRTTYRLMGIADFITLANALFGSIAIFMLTLAVDGLHDPYGTGIRNQYIWAAVLFIILSVIGDIIDGPIARKYSKRRILGGSLDIMSDCLSFCVAPALMIFVMFGRMGSATPFWTVLVAIGCCWLIATGMLRLARFAHEEGGYVSYFNGLSSPASALLLISLSLLIWLQPSTGIGPSLSSWDCNPLCFGKGGNKPYFDFLILPLMVIAGAMMISDRKLPKLKKGLPMYASIVQMLCLLIATIIMMVHISGGGGAYDLGISRIAAVLLLTSSILVLLYFIMGPSIVAQELQEQTSEE